MILGLDGLHSNQGTTFNEQGVLPRIRLDAIPGLRNLPEFEATNDPATGRLGEIPRTGERGGKSFTYEGTIIAADPKTLRELEAELGAQFADTKETLWRSYPNPTDPHYDGSEERQFYARPLDFAPVEQWPESLGLESHGFEQGFTLVVRMSDPRFYFPTEEVITDATLATLAGIGVPATPPMEVDAPSDQGLQVAAPNAGNIATEAIITVGGGVWNPVVTNQTTGKFLRFQDLNVAGGESFTIDSRRRKIVKNDGNNIRNKMDPLSTWWDRGEPFLQSGNNDIRLRGYTIGAGAELTVTYRSADIA